jgi:hypothetical protein
MIKNIAVTGVLSFPVAGVPGETNGFIFDLALAHRDPRDPTDVLDANHLEIEI